MRLSGKGLCEAITYEITGLARSVDPVRSIYTNYASDYHVFDDSIPSHGEDFPESS